MDVIDYAEPKRRKKLPWSIVGGVVLMAAAIMLVTASRHSSNFRPPEWYQARCASNLHQIGLAILLYSNDHNGEYPDSFQTMMRDEKIEAAAFICPASNNEPATGSTRDDIIKHFADPHHVSYIYLGAGLNAKDVKNDQVIAYDNPSNHDPDCINILFGDGHTEFKDKKTAIALIPNLATANWTQR